MVTGTRVCARTVSRTSPVTTKGDVEDGNVLLKVLYDVARIASGEERVRSTPRFGVRCALVDIVGNDLTSDELDLDRLCVPNMCIDTTAVHVESMSVGAIIVVSKKPTSSVVTIDSLAPFPTTSPTVKAIIEGSW